MLLRRDLGKWASPATGWLGLHINSPLIFCFLLRIAQIKALVEASHSIIWLVADLDLIL